MVKPKTDVWDYFEESQKDNKKTSSVKCKFCKNEYAKNSTRMKSHILTCVHVPQPIKSIFKYKQQTLASVSTQGNTHQSDNSTISATVASERYESEFNVNTPKSSRSLSQSQVSQGSSAIMMGSFLDRMKKDEQVELDVLMARAIYTSNSPFSLVGNKDWQTFFEKIRPSFVLPSRYLLANRLLNEEFDRVEVRVEDKLNHSENLSLQCDGWSNLRNESIINFVITTPDPVFVKTVLTKTERHDAVYLERIITEVLEKYNAKKFLALVTDNASNMIKATKLCQTKFPHLISYGCLAHTLHLLCNDILKIESVDKLISNVKGIVKTIKASQLLCAKFSEIKKEVKVNASLSLPVNTRWGSHVKCLQDLIKCKFVLQRLCICENATIQEKMHSTKTSLLDEVFWNSIEMLTELLKPITEAITYLEGDTPAIHLVCEFFKDIEKRFSENLQFASVTETEREKAKDIFFKRREYAIHPIHLAADLLNPQSMGSNLLPDQRISAMRFINQMAKERNLTAATTELGDFLAKSGFFSESFLWDILHETNIITWWKGFCGHTSLSQIAVRILTMPCTSAATERSFSTQSNIHTKKRNKLTAERAAKLNYIQHNLKLLRSIRDEKRPASNATEISEIHRTSEKTVTEKDQRIELPLIQAKTTLVQAVEDENFAVQEETFAAQEETFEIQEEISAAQEETSSEEFSENLTSYSDSSSSHNNESESENNDVFFNEGEEEIKISDQELENEEMETVSEVKSIDCNQFYKKRTKRTSNKNKTIKKKRLF